MGKRRVDMNNNCGGQYNSSNGKQYYNPYGSVAKTPQGLQAIHTPKSLTATAYSRGFNDINNNIDRIEQTYDVYKSDDDNSTIGGLKSINNRRGHRGNDIVLVQILNQQLLPVILLMVWSVRCFCRFDENKTSLDNRHDSVCGVVMFLCFTVF